LPADFCYVRHFLTPLSLDFFCKSPLLISPFIDHCFKPYGRFYVTLKSSLNISTPWSLGQTCFFTPKIDRTRCLQENKGNGLSSPDHRKRILIISNNIPLVSL